MEFNWFGGWVTFSLAAQQHSSSYFLLRDTRGARRFVTRFVRVSPDIGGGACGSCPKSLGLALFHGVPNPKQNSLLEVKPRTWEPNSFVGGVFVLSTRSDVNTLLFLVYAHTAPPCKHKRISSTHWLQQHQRTRGYAGHTKRRIFIVQNKQKQCRNIFYKVDCFFASSAFTHCCAFQSHGAHKDIALDTEQQHCSDTWYSSSVAKAWLSHTTSASR